MSLFCLPWLLVAIVSSTATLVAGGPTGQVCTTSADCTVHPIGTITCFSGQCYTCNDMASHSVPYPTSGDICVQLCDGPGSAGDAECKASTNPNAICVSPALATWAGAPTNGYWDYNGGPTYKSLSNVVSTIGGFCAPCSSMPAVISATGATCTSSSTSSPPPTLPQSPPPAPSTLSSPPPSTTTASPPPTPQLVSSSPSPPLSSSTSPPGSPPGSKKMRGSWMLLGAGAGIVIVAAILIHTVCYYLDKREIEARQETIRGPNPNPKTGTIHPRIGYQEVSSPRKAPTSVVHV